MMRDSETANSWFTPPSRFDVKTTVFPSGVSCALVSFHGLCEMLYSVFVLMS